ncbi:hypothetical protein L5515_002347 [Caenorhabditis briggsae]|uniref:WD repeat-containing protein 75 second beta-propeller domain-containing protein n=2 Tax=Caenorhabditis briggsae TaxID=6238 RepID=A0AAE9E3W0_CAEBR|nr:hypothetical protein L5515_002347 [Caenorhabditis briggsae]
MENAERIEVTLVDQPYSNLVISPNNGLLSVTTGTLCEIRYLEKSGAARQLLKHDSNVVAAFFQSEHRLITVTENGEVSEFEAGERGFEKKSSKRVTAFPVVCAFAQKSSSSDTSKDLEIWLVVEKSADVTSSKNEKTYDVCVIGANGSFFKVLEIPSDCRKEQISIENRVVSYAHRLDVHSIVLKDVDFSVIKETKFTAKNGGHEGGPPHEIERLASNGNYLVAAISDGRILQWSNLRSAGVSDTHHRIHWHKVGIHVAVTQFGNVLSAGAECVLARHSKGQKEPTKLPRLAAPVTGLVLSDDSSTCALVMEDNSIHTVLLATMAIKSLVSTLEYCPRSLNTVFCSDPLRPRDIVMNGKPGHIQWFDAATAYTLSKMHVTLENTIDGDMSSRGIKCAFRDVLTVAFTQKLVATIEKFVHFDGENHLRFWKRKGNATDTVLVASIAVPKDVVMVATCQTPTASRFVNTIITASTSGTLSVWDYTEKEVLEDMERSRNWQETEIRDISMIQANGKFVSAHGQHAVLWSVKNMKIIDVLSCDDDILKVSFAADERHLIISTKKGVICWDTLCLLVVWRIQQRVGIHVGYTGCYALDGPQVMKFDAESGRVLETVQFSTPVEELIVVEKRQNAIVYVAKTAKGILCNRPRKIKQSGKSNGAVTDLKTPFSQLARQNSTTTTPKSTSSSGDQQFVRQPRPEAARLFAGPVYQLPPISFIAPLFIEKSLLPPPVRS